MEILDLRKVLGDLKEARFIRRINRFTAEVELNGKKFLAHISDTGRLAQLLETGRTVVVSDNKGKLDYKLVAVKVNGEFVLVATFLHSKIAEVLILSGVLGFKPKSLKREVKVKNHRIDFLADGRYVEVKGCNLLEENVCLFPDAPTIRGREHLELLKELATPSKPNYVLFLAFRNCSKVSPNWRVDENFSKSLKSGIEEGKLVAVARRIFLKNYKVFASEEDLLVDV